MSPPRNSIGPVLQMKPHAKPDGRRPPVADAADRGVGEPDAHRRPAHAAASGAAEVLEEPQPHLAHRGECRHGMPETRRRGTSPTMAIVAACRSSATSCPTNVAPMTVPRSASTTRRARPVVAVGEDAGTARRLDRHVGDAHVAPGLLGPLRGEPDRRRTRVRRRRPAARRSDRPSPRARPTGRCRPGARRPGRDHVAGGAALVLALVGEQRPVVHVADGVQPVAVAVGALTSSVSSTSSQEPGSRPTVSSPTGASAACGPWRRAPRRRSPSSRRRA